MKNDSSVDTSALALSLDSTQENVCTSVSVSNCEHFVGGNVEEQIDQSIGLGDSPESQIFSLPQNKVFSTLTAFLAALFPVLIMLIFIGFFHKAFAAMFMMHWIGMVFPMLLHIFFISKRTLYYSCFFCAQLLMWRRKLLCSVVGFVFGTVYLYLSYRFLKCDGWLGLCIEKFHKLAIHQGLNTRHSVLIAVGVYFVTVNPIIEEFFWRVFLTKEFGCMLFSKNSDTAECQNETITDFLANENDQEVNKNNEFQAGNKTGETSPFIFSGENNSTELCDISATLPNSTPIGPRSESHLDDGVELLEGVEESKGCWVECGRLLTCWKYLPKEDEAVLMYRRNAGCGVRAKIIKDVQLSERGNLICAMLYAAYHTVVLYNFMGLLFACIGFCIVALLGRLLFYLRNTFLFGFLGAVGFHAGVDFGVALALLSVVDDASS